MFACLALPDPFPINIDDFARKFCFVFFVLFLAVC